MYFYVSVYLLLGIAGKYTEPEIGSIFQKNKHFRPVMISNHQKCMDFYDLRMHSTL